jgi:dihydroflavonol-4-reductase
MLTGATGFIGSRVASQLRVRGDEVVALVRSPARATALVGMGCEIVEGDLSDRIAIDRAVDGADAVVHLAARYEVGIPKVECPKMEDVNVGGVRRVLDSAVAAGTPRIVYGSTVAALGNTGGRPVAENHKRTDATPLTCYDRSKLAAHRLAVARAEAGAPIVIVMPGVVYGPDDHSEVGRELLLAANGRLSMPMFTDAGFSFVYVDDVASGIVAALDRGEIGESYLLGGDNVTFRQALQTAAALGGKRIPRRDIPKFLVKLIAPAGSLVGPLLGFPPNLRELIRAVDGVTYWVDSGKAQTALGFSARPFEEGIRETLVAAGFSLQ